MFCFWFLFCLYQQLLKHLPGCMSYLFCFIRACMLTLLLVDVLSAETSVCLLACHICFALFARTCFLLLLAFYSRVLAPAETSVCLMSYLFCFIRAYLLSQRFAFGFFLLVFVFIFVGVLAPACFLFLSAETSACLLACHIYFACLRTRSCWII